MPALILRTTRLSFSVAIAPYGKSISGPDLWHVARWVFRLRRKLEPRARWPSFFRLKAEATGARRTLLHVARRPCLPPERSDSARRTPWRADL